MRYSVLLAFFLMGLAIVRGQDKAKESLQLKGRIIDSQTRKDLPGATVQLLSGDSTILASQSPNNHWVKNGQEGYSSNFSFTVPKQNATYIFRVSFMGYKTTCVEYTIGDVGRREFIREIPPIGLRENPIMIKEVDIVASKVKFYNRGDTVVYNADAFLLAEGSMLDALVRQLPGVEIRSDGRIYHNGQFVESLLLNGKDFFRGNPEVMLENLPGYTVKQVEVYDKYGKKSEFLGEKKEDDRRYVMDVRLKKEYAVGTVANAEAGYGTGDRGLARLFAMRYTDASRLAFYGNANNLSDRRKPGQDTNWSPEQMEKGENRDLQAGADYSVSDRKGRFEVSGNVEVAHSDQNLKTDVDRINFLPQNNTYEYSRTTAGNRNLSLKTSHYIDLMMKQAYIHLEPTVSYSSYNRDGLSVDAAFSAMQRGVDRELLENLYSPDMPDSVRKVVINRNRKQTLGKGHSFRGSLTADATVKFRGSSDHVDISAGISGESGKDDFFNRYVINYGSSGQTAASGDQYFRNRPNRQLSYKVFATYHYRLSQTTSLALGYGHEHQHRTKNSSLFLLDSLPDSGGTAIGILPSVAEYERTIDRANSYNSVYDEGAHNIVPAVEWRRSYEKGSLYIYARLFVTPTRQRLDYQRGCMDTTVVRNTMKLTAPFWLMNWSNNDHSVTSQLMFNMQTKTPDLVNMIDVTDSTDPMNIRIGNPSLKNQTGYELTGLIRKSDRQRQTMASLRMEYRCTDNAIAMGYSYDSTTGVRTYRAENVDGNWAAAVSFDYDTPLDKMRRLTLTTKTRGEYQNSVDLIGEGATGNYATVGSSVHTVLLKEMLKLNYKTASGSLVGIKADGTWQSSNSGRRDFERINAVNFSYGAVATINLPYHLQLSTDLTMFSRRGYEGSSMNTDNLIWNARLSFTMLKGRLTWMVDGFDILGRMDNVVRTVNAQGRFETYTNILSRYVLLHAVYKFNKKPKKK